MHQVGFSSDGKFGQRNRAKLEDNAVLGFWFIAHGYLNHPCKCECVFGEKRK